jgi:hypothetical protein
MDCWSYKCGILEHYVLKIPMIGKSSKNLINVFDQMEIRYIC